MSIPEHTTRLLYNLNHPDGPNFRAIVNANYSQRLPEAWRLSFGRVSPNALQGDRAFYEQLGNAFHELEAAGARIVHRDYSLVEPYIGSGIDAPANIAAAYRNWSEPFSVRRLDVVIGEQGPVVGENDEMPGGLTHAYWLDYCYGINQMRWKYAFDWLTSRGPLVFAVSTKWSQPYLAEMAWLAKHLQNRGYKVACITEADMARVRQIGHQLYLDKAPIGTVWRLFPVFEAAQAFQPFVAAAAQKTIRMVPELASWGNKGWFAAFWQHKSAFRAHMSGPAHTLLQRTLPPSAFFGSKGQFPIGLPSQDSTQPWQTFDSFESLRTQPTSVIKTLVAKSAGAHQRAARSHGVLIGRSTTVSKWGQALTELAAQAGPVVLQRFAKPRTHALPMVSVLDSNQATFEPELKSYMLVRPWYIGGRLISAVAFVHPANTVKLHGTISGCEVPLDFG